MSSSIISKQRSATLPGKCFPMGATCMNGGVNFCIFSKHATGMQLVLFPKSAKDQIRIIPLDPEINRTYYYWHIFVPDIGDGQEYGFRVQGPFDPQNGHRFDEEKLLVDPYARALTGWDTYDRDAACRPGSNIDVGLRSVVVNLKDFDWEGDKQLRTPYAESVIYEMHVGGFTRNPNSGVAADKRGTFAGVIEKIPYLKDLGVTAVELMPVQEFDSWSAQPGFENYWGYNTLGFLAPHHGYCRNGDALEGIDEFREMVKALHKAGIEVILDVVFNHTSEGNENGPTSCFRGLDNRIYYQLDQADMSRYSNYSGCGNSFNANHPVAGRLVLDSLQYWVTEMHVDGFRFDLAAALARDVFGVPLQLPPLLWVIESDPVLAGTKLIAEAWDAAGLYRVGWFINSSQWYAEWNGPFRDDVRRFVKSESHTVTNLASRIVASPDLYYKPDREPNRSINFITCHDGFTLNDLVSYNSKHNFTNGENNRDGNETNHSWNCGLEGTTDDPEVCKLRLKQMKNLITILFMSQGTPMILMGDEVARSQQGNNNAYCQNNELAWFDWDAVQRNCSMLRFHKEIIAFTQSIAIFKQCKTIGTEPSSTHPYIQWHGVKLNQPDWSADSHSTAFTLVNESCGERVHVMLNAYWEPLEFQLPPVLRDDLRWHRIVDTSLETPHDISSGEAMPPLANATTYSVAPRSSVVLFERQA